MLNIKNIKVKINHCDYFRLWITFVVKWLHIYDIFIFIVDVHFTKVEKDVNTLKHQAKNQSLYYFRLWIIFVTKWLHIYDIFIFIVDGHITKAEKDVNTLKHQGENQSLWLFLFVNYICNKMITYPWHFYLYSWWVFYEIRRRC